MRSVTPEQKEEILYAAAGRVRSLVEEHFRARKSRRFWKEAADSVQVEPGNNGTLNVQIFKRGVHLRYAGGTVKPTGQISELTGKPIKSLLIPGPRTPMRTQAYRYATPIQMPRFLAYPPVLPHLRRRGTVDLFALRSERLKSHATYEKTTVRHRFITL